MILGLPFLLLVTNWYTFQRVNNIPLGGKFFLFTSLYFFFLYLGWEHSIAPFNIFAFADKKN